MKNKLHVQIIETSIFNGFLFRSEIFFQTTQELEYLFILQRKARIFFPEFNISLYDKYSDFFFSSTKIRIFFSATLGIRIFFQKKNITPLPFKLNGRSLRRLKLLSRHKKCIFGQIKGMNSSRKRWSSPKQSLAFLLWPLTLCINLK